MRARRISATIAIASILTAACGSGSPDTPTADPAPPAAAAPEPAVDSGTPADAVDTEGADTDPNTDPVDTGSTDTEALPPADEAPTADEPASDDGAGEDVATDQPEPDPEPVGDAQTMAWPDDGCSADNSPTPASAADGPPPILELRAESADSPLPDVAVRRINCSGGWANFRNELPSDRPLLVWFWAPH